MTFTQEALLTMPRDELAEVMHRAHPIPTEALDDTQYLGIDLSLPGVVHRLLWKTFRKTFHRDRRTGVLRGWNVRLEQRGVTGPQAPLRRRDGTVISFGHYHLLSAVGKRFPGGWKGHDYLDS